jgi:hypothetical protein
MQAAEHVGCVWSAQRRSLLCVQAVTKAVTGALQTFKLATLDATGALPAMSSESKPLRALMHLVNDHRIQLHTFPDRDLFARMPEVLQAVADSPAATQSGMSAYALLSPVAAALDDLQMLARGDASCADKQHRIEQRVLQAAGPKLWVRLQTNFSNQGEDGVCLPYARDCLCGQCSRLRADCDL